MKFQFLGVGSGLCLKLGNNNVLLNDSILIDCGFTSPDRLKRLGKLKMLEDIFITHLHGDHCHGLEVLGFMNLFVFKRKTRLWLTRSMEEELWENVLKGTMGKLKSMDHKPLEAHLYDFFDVEYIEDHHFTFEKGDLKMVLFPTEHVPDKESYSIEIYDKNQPKFLYSSDIAYPITKYVPHAEKFEVIFHDCQLFETPSDIHTSINTLRALPEAIKSKIILMHYGDDIEKQDVSQFKGVAQNQEIFS